MQVSCDVDPPRGVKTVTSDAVVPETGKDIIKGARYYIS